MKIAYFNHDLVDASIIRRVRMFAAGGADMVVLGFRRSAECPPDIEGFPVFDLGQTHDAGLAHRALTVLRHSLLTAKIKAAIKDCDIVVARNLECLAIAVQVADGRPVVYECLDIHRVLLSSSPASRLLQAFEAKLLKHVKLLITSSPAYVENYFALRPSFRGKVLLVENKLLTLGRTLPPAQQPPAGPPWVIGWFGLLRCRRSFDALADIARRGQGRVEVLLAGKPSPAEFQNFAEIVEQLPHMRFVGAYQVEDLPSLYGQCHFAWAIDWFEDGLNSSWLLPNRIYESAALGVVPVALEGVEVGRWLRRQEAGLVLADPASDLHKLLIEMTPDVYAGLRRKVSDIPNSKLISDEQDCKAIISAFSELS